ncbi:MAG TPA: alpha/beta hydrolase [Burkholderiaceae bacterium]|nr:alpha/beta hydrolase [Burkholderiaceae bacterium]
MRVHFTNVAGVPTRYFRAGEGHPVLLLHGVGMTSDSWCCTMPALARRFDVIAPDMLDNGFTGSGSYQGGPPHGPMLDHLAALLDALGIRQAHVVGSSFGATLAVLMRVRHPERTGRVVITSSGSVFKKAEDLARMYRNAYENGAAALRDPTYDDCRRRLANLFHDPSKIPHELVLLQLTPFALPNALASFERRLKGMMDVEAMRQYEVGHLLETIDTPMLAVWGRQDQRGEHALAEKVFARLPSVRFETFDGCGHLPHLECVDRFNETVADFLSK